MFTLSELNHHHVSPECVLQTVLVGQVDGLEESNHGWHTILVDLGRNLKQTIIIKGTPLALKLCRKDCSLFKNLYLLS